MADKARSNGRRRPRSELPPDAPEADVVEQAQPWDEEEPEGTPRVPPDAPERDVVDQHRPADPDDQERDRGES